MLNQKIEPILDLEDFAEIMIAISIFRIIFLLMGKFDMGWF